LVPSVIGAAHAGIDLPHVRGTFLKQGVTVGAALACIFAATAFIAPRLYGDHHVVVPWQLILPLAVYIAALCVRTLCGGLLQAEGRFIAISAFGGAGMLGAVLLILYLRPPLAHLGWLIAGGELIATACSLIFLAKVAPLTLAKRPDATAVARLFWRKGGPESFGRLITRANPAVDQLMVANIAGGITLIRLGSDLAGVGAQILQLTVLPLLLTHLSWRFAAGKFAQHRRETSVTCMVAGTAVALFSVAAWCARTWLVRHLFGSSAMSEMDITRLAHVFGFQLLGAPFMAMQLVLARSLTSAGHGGFLFPLGIFNIAANFILNLLLLPLLGLAGVALSTSLVTALVFGLLWAKMLMFWRRNGGVVQTAASTPAAAT